MRIWLRCIPADEDYEAGTVVKIGGEAEVTKTLAHADR